jgi:hypothetical protein
MGRKKTKNTNANLKENLLKAIDAAILPGEVVYIYEDKPCCVIAQLATIEGITVDTMKKWDVAHMFNKIEQSEEIGQLLQSKARGTGPLKKYPIDLLEKVQGIWDRPTADNEDEIREQAKQVVENYYV